MTNPTVFEYAKEIGIETLTLMDKIRKWNLPVKNHMAKLEPEVIEEIRQRLLEERGKLKTKVKKTVTKKKPLKAESEKEEVKTTKVEKKKISKKSSSEGIELKSSKKGVKTQTTQVSEESIELKKGVIRRKAIDKVALEMQEAARLAPRKEELEIQPSEEQAPLEAESESVQKLGESEISFPPTPISSKPQRGNIIGKIDLNKVRKPESPQMATPTSSQSRVARTNSGRTLRTGFVASEPIRMPEPELQDRERRSRKDDKKKRVLVEGAGGVAPSFKSGEVADFNVTEFRKREIVFQPKKKKATLGREGKKTQITTPKASKRVVKVYGTISVSDLAQGMGIKATELIKKLMSNGVVAKINSDLDFETVALLVPDFGFEAINVHQSADELMEKTAFGNLEAEDVSRPPVVTVMGHVDHGKTTLLDVIRATNVVSGEAGGITQHIGAYSVTLEDGDKITFIDTPGHAAFTAMRARGAHVTDIVILVVAADDGVMPQTIEAINHAKAAGAPIIVAVNKIDRPDANLDKIKQQLTEYELIPEEWGGTTAFCPISALKKQGIKELLEHVVLVAEMLELKANPERSASGVVIESRRDKGRGNVATLLVQNGTLKVGQIVVAGKTSGRVRSLFDEHGKTVKQAGPGIPIEVLGLDESPSAGDRFDVCQNEVIAKEIIQQRVKEEKLKEAAKEQPLSLEALLLKVEASGPKELKVILKSDVAGSNEAIISLLEKLSTDKAKIKVIHSAVGGITENDVMLASTSGAIIIGFNVRPSGETLDAAKRENVEIRTYTIIYELSDDLKKMLQGLLEPEIVEKIIGRVEVRNTFSLPKIGTIAGSYVLDGKISRDCLLRLVRDGRVIYQGRIGSLKRFKDDAKEVASGYECGVGIENYNDIKVGDVIEAYVKDAIPREL